jgi:small GTP-binding protein
LATDAQVWVMSQTERMKLTRPMIQQEAADKTQIKFPFLSLQLKDSGSSEKETQPRLEDTVENWYSALNRDLLASHSVNARPIDFVVVASSPRDKQVTAMSIGAPIIISDRTEKGWGAGLLVIEGHIGPVASLSFSADGRLLASKSSDNTVRLWDCSTWKEVARFDEPGEARRICMAFHPTDPVLATCDHASRTIRIWDVDIDTLLRAGATGEVVRYTSAKIVLVGESNVGKSCLAMRLAEGRYPKDDEQGTTHGMRFWPLDAEKLHPSAKPPPDQRRDVVLWDMGGQDEYRLVHQLFLHDTTLALVLIDPTRGRVAHDEARDWNRRLAKQLEGRDATRLLIGAEMDRSSKLVNRAAIEELCRECNFSLYVDVSAKTARNLDRLRQSIASAIDWDRLAKTSRPELFQRIRDHIDERRKKGELVVLLEDLKVAIREAHREIYEEAPVEAVVEQLASQGVIVQTRLAGGERAVVLQLPVIERYAGSLIVAARNNPRVVPALEERLLGSPRIPLPGMEQQGRLKDRLQERIVLECVAELMIQHGICFRHDGLLVFPTLFPEGGGNGDAAIPHSVSLFYDFTGPIDNIYASLVARLMISGTFGDGRLWPGRVEFDSPGHGVCGIRQVKRTGGLAHVDLFFAEETRKDRRQLFTRFVEDHLQRQGVEIREHQAMGCRGCKKTIAEDIVRENIERGQKDVLCPYCRTPTLISEGAAQIREREPESDSRV